MKISPYIALLPGALAMSGGAGARNSNFGTAESQARVPGKQPVRVGRGFSNASCSLPATAVNDRILDLLELVLPENYTAVQNLSRLDNYGSFSIQGSSRDVSNSKNCQNAIYAGDFETGQVAVKLEIEPSDSQTPSLNYNNAEKAAKAAGYGFASRIGAIRDPDCKTFNWDATASVYPKTVSGDCNGDDLTLTATIARSPITQSASFTSGSDLPATSSSPMCSSELSSSTPTSSSSHPTSKSQIGAASHPTAPALLAGSGLLAAYGLM